MKKHLFFLLGGLLAATASLAQTTAGRIQYEVTERVDPSKLRVIINGEQVKPGSPDFPTDLPDSRSSQLTLTFAGNYAKEEHERPIVRTTIAGPSSAPEVRTMARPFTEATYLDLGARKSSTVFTTKDRLTGQSVSFRAEAPVPAPPAGWQTGTQTRKIAGYSCRKVTVTHNRLPYTLWVATDLPFTYSPVKALTPEKGVVLALESEREQYQATKVSLQAVPEAQVRPAGEAKLLSAAELQDLREKTLADLRQQMMEEAAGQGR